MSGYKNKITSLEHSRKLKELSVTPKSSLAWVSGSNKSDDFTLVSKMGLFDYSLGMTNEQIYLIAAFDLYELMERLPAWVDTKISEPFNNFYLKIQKRSSLNIQYIVNYYCDTVDPQDMVERKLIKPSFFDENLITVCSELLIYLIENNLVSDSWRKQWMEEVKK
jgi:hypothetical protein